MRFTTKEELIEQAIKDGACDKGIEFAKSCKDLQEIFETIDKNMLWWCLTNGYDQFAEHCDLSKFSGTEWAVVLQDNPQFADRCDWSKLNDYNWDYLLKDYPQFEVYRQNSNGA